MDTEISQLLDVETFLILKGNQKAPEGYTQVPLIIVFNVKHDG